MKLIAAAASPFVRTRKAMNCVPTKPGSALALFYAVNTFGVSLAAILLGIGCRRVFRHHRVEARLWHKLARDMFAAQGHTHDTPITAAHCHRSVGVDSLVGWMKGTEAKMENARLD